MVFVAEGDLWRVSAQGGDAQRITSHPGAEAAPAISPDGKWVAFTGAYEGPGEAYVMPITGGLPKRLTWFGDRAEVVGWNGNTEVLVATRYFHGLRKARLVAVNVEKGTHRVVPLEEAGSSTTLADGTLVFTVGDRYGDNVRNYRGGAMTALWKFRDGAEATPLTKLDANSSMPRPWGDRIVFLSDRNGGVMNIWSMAGDGSDLRQHTRHADFEVRGVSVAGDRAVYQLGADLRSLDLKTNEDRALPVRLVSDFDQQRERWIRRPLENFTMARLSSNGDRIAVTARGAVVTAGIGALRRITIALPPGARARSAELMPDGKTVLVVADGSGEMELWLYPADGSGPGRQLTKNADTTRLEAVPSPDGKWVVHHDRRHRLWLLEVASGRDRMIDEMRDQTGAAFANFAWSPDSSAFAAERFGPSDARRVVLYRVSDGKAFPLTSTRYQAGQPSFSPDGRWLWFLGNRNFEAMNAHPWGDRNMGPFFDKRTRIYAVSLQPGNRFPFQPRDELEVPKPEPEKADPTKPAPVRVEPPKTEPSRNEPAKGWSGAMEGDGQTPPPAPAPVTPPATPSTPATPAPTSTTPPSTPPPAGTPGQPPRPVTPPKVPAIVYDGVEKRLYEVPLPAGNYTALASDGKRLWYLEAETSPEAKATLKSVPIDNSGAQPETWSADVRQFAISDDAKKLFVRKWATAPQPGDMYIVDPTPRPPTELPKFQVRLADWQFTVTPREEWNGLFADVWRMQRDWFYDRNLHGVDWPAIRRKYGALLPRVTDRDELNDLLAQMTAELQLLHSQVRPGEVRRGEDNIAPGSLGAFYEKVGDGVRIAKIYRADPELLNDLPPLARTEVGAKDGDVLVAIDGRPVKEIADVFSLLRDRAGKQVLVELKTGGAASRKAIVTPVPFGRENEMKRRDYEWRVREKVDAASKGRFGYLYLRAMGPQDIASFAREYYPNIDREGLIIDVRGNGGGSVDSIIIEKLMRRAWAYWRAPGGGTFMNMQKSFRGHVVVLIDAGTYSDGETFAEGIKRLGIGTVIGKRTAGAGVWLSDSNTTIDGAGPRTAEFGQFAPDGKWIIEGTGVTPDIEVDNLPNATFRGEDAQLAAAMRVLEEKLREKPVVKPVVPR